MSAGTPASNAFPRPMTCAAAEAALGAYALGALEPDERRDIDAHLDGCARCRAALARHDAALAAIAEAVPPAAPPPNLRHRLLTEIATTAQQAEPSPAPAAAPVALDPWRWRRAAVVLAAAAAILLIALGLTAAQLRQTQSQRDDVMNDHRDVALYLRHGGVMTALIPVSGAVGGAEGSLIVAPDQPRALLVVVGLAPAKNGVYRAWAERGGQRIWLAPLELGSDGTGYLMTSAPAPLASYDRIGIALQSPGSPDVDLFVAPVPNAPPATSPTSSLASTS